jgi:DNA polymerase alpha-associated DNA helicase A
MSDSIVAEFVAEQRELLNLEFEADSDETATTSKDERAAHILLNLEASDLSVGLYGRTVVELSLVGDNAAGEVRLPAHRFTVGDEVQIRKQNKKNSPTGVISAVSDTFINVALSQNNSSKGGKDAKSQSKKKNGAEDDEDEVGILSQPPFSLVPMSSVQVHRKMVRALDELEKQGAGHPIAGHIVEAMFHSDLKFNEHETHARSEIQPFNPSLDQSQLEAISFALQSDRSIALIHGPPGTGKTTTIAELIHQAVHVHKMKVLVSIS